MVANVVSTPATFRPPFTTLFHRRAITSPKAVARDVEMVLRTSAIEILRSSAISNPDARWARVPKPFPEANKYRSAGAHALLLRHDPHAFNPRARILPLRVFLERLRHVPNREQRNRDAVERLHLDAGLIRRLDGGRRDDSIGPHVERHARGGHKSRRRHARAQGRCQVATSDAKSVMYDARASRRQRADGMRVTEGMGRATAPRPPGMTSFDRAIATCATRNKEANT